jgi:hypothetical protein
MPVVLARLFQSNVSEQNEEEQAIEQKLIKTLVDFVQYSQKFQADQQVMSPNMPTNFTSTLLQNIRQCIKSVMVSRMEKSLLRQALLSSRARAEVMHVIVQVGDKVSQDVDPLAKADWAQMKEAFLSMLDS